MNVVQWVDSEIFIKALSADSQPKHSPLLDFQPNIPPPALQAAGTDVSIADTHSSNVYDYASTDIHVYS